MDTTTKQISISVPSDMDEKTAQQLFMFGLRNFGFIYRGGVVVNYALEDKKGIHNHIYYEQEAGAVIDFVHAIDDIKKEWKQKKEELEDIGSIQLNNIIAQNENSSVQNDKKD